MARPKKKPEETLENLACRVLPEVYAEIDAIAGNLDRPMSYIARKLVMRGLMEYRKDGLLDAPSDSEPQPAPAKKPVKATREIGIAINPFPNRPLTEKAGKKK